MIINNRKIGANFKPLVIAEISGNHNGSLDNIIKIIKIAKKVGIEAIKLQTYTPDSITINSTRKEFYVDKNSKLWGGENLYKLYSKGYTPWEWHQKIFQEAKKNNIICFSSPFDETAVDFLEKINTPLYKIASFEITHIPLLKKIAKTKKPVIISTGMASLKEIRNAVKVFKSNGLKDIILLKCTSNYPASPENSNLITIRDMKEKFDLEVGLSDHTIGMGASIAAVSLGATVIEKHICLDKNIKSIDSEFSLEAKDFKQFIEEINSAWLSIGNTHYGPTKEEVKSLKYRRSIYIINNLKKHSIISENDLKIIRPNLGLEPKHYEKVLGKKAKRNLKSGSPLKLDDFY